jgi:hypothetical protein
MKGVLFASVLSAVLVPTIGHAADWTVSSAYIFEKQAFVASSSPVANVSFDLNPILGITPNVWAQVGENKLSTELDITGSVTRELGPIEVTVLGGGYFYPVGGGKPIYTAAVSAAVPMGPVTLAGNVQRYEGWLKSTQINMDASVAIKKVNFTLGKAWNDPEDLNPWYGEVSFPLGTSEQAPRLAVRGFWNAGAHIAVDLRGVF